MADPAFLELAVQASLVLVSVLTLLAAYRVVVGPSVPDRVVGLDTIATNVVAIGVLVAMASGFGGFVLVGLVLAIIGFVSTVTVAEYLTEGDIIQ
ncbi:MAG: monovalent cation/H+ antiporter complex subunit F [Halobacteriales archaeon]|nr:monovalent cation/H+ antiporter complex subunit F [Halobacteriales archaeon]